MRENKINFIHIGGDIVINKNDIIGIFNINLSKKSKVTRDFLDICNEEGFVTKITDEEIRSFVIVDAKGKKKSNNKKYSNLVVYYSPISSLTLQKRSCSSY